MSKNKHPKTPDWSAMKSGEEVVISDISQYDSIRIWRTGYYHCYHYRKDHKIIKKRTPDGYLFIMAKKDEAKDIKESLGKAKYVKRVTCIGMFSVDTCKLKYSSRSWEDMLDRIMIDNTPDARNQIREAAKHPKKDVAFGYRWAYFQTDNQEMPDDEMDETLEILAEKKYYASRMRDSLQDPASLTIPQVNALKICLNTFSFEEQYITKKNVKSK